MSRVTKWKLEKTKVKVVFRLQFHATHVPQAGWDKLFISFISVDSGKATAKTTKANVRNGTCKWGDPIYESTRLLLDTKTKQYDEKLYKLVVTMGSSRSSVLGETNINLADYADASKPSAVALPLYGCDSGTVLHATVQLLTSKTGFREFEQQRELRESGLRSTSDQNRNDVSSARRISSSEDTGRDQIDKMNAGVNFKEFTPLEEEVRLNEEYADSTVDGSSNTSESLYAEKHDTSSTQEVDSLKSTTSGDLGALPRSQCPGQEKGYSSDRRFLAQRTNEWPHGWGSDYSADADLSNTYEENSRLRGSLEAAESSILELKQEVRSLQNNADEIGIEAQKFSLQLDAEIASGERLAKEVSILRSECSMLKEDIDKQKSSKLSTPFTNRKTTEREQDHFFQELQLRWLKGISDVEDRIRELQSKACFGVHERDSRSFHPDFESLLGALQVLKQEAGGANSGTGMLSVMQNDEICLLKGAKSVIGTRFGADSYQPEGVFASLNMPGVVAQDFESIDAGNAMKGKVFELLRELEEVKTDRESLAKKADQMECYYEALIQELEENQRQMMGELQNLRNEHSTCLYTIASDKAEMERIQQDMTNETVRFSKEQRDLDSLNKELERRATTAEAALKRARMNYSIAVDQLQKDLEMLSFQIVSMYETNESLIKQAFADSLLPRFQDCEEIVQNQKLNSAELHTAKDLLCQNSCNGIMKKHLDGDTLSDELRRSLLLQRRLYQKVEEELYEVHLANLYLDVFSKTLQATLFEASVDFKLSKEKVHELSQQLAHSTESNELLMLRLQAALDEIRCLNEYKDTCTMNYNDLALKNQILEENLQNASSENALFTQKISECKRMIKEYETYQSKYTACAAEKLELANSLEKEILENDTLQNRVTSLEEELRSVRTDFDKLADVKEDMQNTVKLLQGKLWNLLASYDQMYNGLSLCSVDVCKDLEPKDLTGVVSQIEELQHNMNEKIVQLMEEKKDLAQKRDIVQESLSAAESYNLIMKQKFEHDLRGMMDKLDFSNALVQKLQLQVEAIAKRSDMSSKDEENYAQQHKELLSGLDHLERELQQLTSSSQVFSEQFMAIEKVTEELGRCNMTIAALSQEKEAFLVSLQDKTEASSKLALELNSVQASLLSLHDELQIERNLRDKLEITVTDLTSQLEEKDTQLLGFDQQKAELIHLKQLVSDLELEKSRVYRLLLDSEESLKDVSEACSTVSVLEDQLFEMDEYSIAADIGLIFTTTQYQSRIEELGKCKLTIAALTEEKQTLMVSLQDKTEESSKILLELSILQGSLQSLHDELQIERHLKGNLESTLTDLTSELNKKNCRLLDFDHHQYELGQLKQLVSDLELEKSRILHLLLDSEECLKGVRKECSSVPALEAELSEMQEFSVAADVELTFIKTQYKAMVEELVQELHFSDSQVSELHNNHLDVGNMLTRCLASQKHYLEENTNLMTRLKSLNSELEGSSAQNRILLDTNSAMRTELEEYQKRAENLKAIVHMDKSQSALEIERLEHVLMTFEEEIDKLIFSKEELEVKVLVIKAKLDEQCSQLTLLEGYKDERTLLHDKCSELSKRLAEQVLKTEEFKNLSIHFKELKDKAYAEGLHAHDKREAEGPPAAALESLRIAFIKEQYETKLQELKQQLAMSNKHSEEMLWKLQDSINEVENRKKSEATYTKRNEELGMRMLELESDLHSVLSEKREIMKAYDLMKAEKECSLISLECCKEEKQELEASLQKCDEEKVKISLELSSVKELLDSSSSSTNSLKEGNGIIQKAYSISERFCRQYSIPGMQRNCMTDDQLDGEACSNSIDETNQPNVIVNSEQEDLRSGGANGIPSVVHSQQKDALNSDMKHLVLANEHFKGQSLKSSMENLNKELERMKHENLILPLDDHHFDRSFPGLQRELMQLNKVNEELGSKFPLFNEFSCSGNALERVLALEVELAEALQTKKKSVVQFQSSFLRQHSDEEAVFHSFRDINELIKDMLEIKGRYATVETELREMHDRYSQLSLQFAEVEGERQKLMMSLKNVRASKKALSLNCSSTGTFLDPS